MATAAAKTATKKTNGSASEAPVSNRARSALHTGVDKIADTAAAGEGKIRETAAESAESLQQAQRKLDNAWKKSKAREFAIENPLATAGIAFAAGALITSLVKRAKS